MNFKTLNMKKGLKRFWIVGSAFWIGYPFIPPQSFSAFGFRINFWDDVFILYVIITQIIWWALLYVGFWIARGFVDDDDKKAGF